MWALYGDPGHQFQRHAGYAESEYGLCVVERIAFKQVSKACPLRHRRVPVDRGRPDHSRSRFDGRRDP